MTAIVGENEIISVRQFDFPRELVFKAWTTPEQLARWWGPKGFTNTFHECDLRPGGHWRFIMHGPNGVDYPNHSVFEEIVPWERIVLRHLDVPEFQVTATFEQAKTYLAEANEQNFDRLNDLLTELLFNSQP